ncbi:MAG: class I SAM-dependent methyltransferase [Patescibacteria group bacterium]
MIPDQKTVWNNKHKKGDHEYFRYQTEEFAIHVEKLFPRLAQVLDLGCGVGRDAIYFAKHDHTVLGVDFSEEIIRRNREIFPAPNLQFATLDFSKKLPYSSTSYDVVYAYLSLQYFDDVTTRSIVFEIARVLKSGGLLCFVCKSTKDLHYGDGTEIEPNYFVSTKGRIRRFFTSEYTKDLLDESFEIKSLKETKRIYEHQMSDFIECMARKI